MATIGGSQYATAVHEFMDGLGTYDAERACAVLAEDADLQSPWNEGVLTGRDKITPIFAALLANPVSRPSFTITDIRGDGNLVHLDVSMSNRFGRAPVPLRISCLHLKGALHHVMIQGRDGAKVPPLSTESIDLIVPAPEPIAAKAAKAAKAAEPAE